MSFGEYFTAGASLGDAYGAGLDRYNQKTALAKLGERLKVGDYAGAASTAFDSGDPQSGLKLLQLGQQQRQQQLGVEATRDLASSFGLGGPQPGYGPQSDASPVSRALPTFAQGSDIGRYAGAIKVNESGGKYGIVGPTHPKYGRALGAYQVMESNLPSWSREALGREVSPDEFLKNPQIQDAIFEKKFGQAVAKYGNPQDAASVWFTGRPLAQGAKSKDVLGTTGQSYVDKFTASLGRSPASAPTSPRIAVAENEGQVQALEQRMGMMPRQMAGAPVAYADDEAQTQALESRMGMVPQQTASLDLRADMPADDAQPANFQIPGGPNAIPPGLSSDMHRVPNAPNVRRAAPSGMPALDVPTLGGPAPTGRRMTMPGAEGADETAAPVQIAENTRIGGTTAGAISDAPPSQRIQALQRAILNPATPDNVRSFASDMLKRTLDETRMPDGVKEFVYARAHGWTQAQTPGAYAQEKMRNPGADLTSQMDARQDAATRLGLQPGTPEFRSYVLTGKEPTERAERDEGAKITSQIEARKAAAPGLGLEEGSPAWKSFVGTGKLGADRDMSASEKKSIETADGLALTGRQSIDLLRQAKDLSAKAYAGPLASERGRVTSVFGSETGQATLELDNLVTTNALASLKSIFGAAPTEGERKILLDIQGSSSLPHPLRLKIYDRAIAAAEARADQNEQKADAIRNGTYFKRGGGAAIRGGGADAEQPRSLPAPSPSNRPDAPPAADRFKQLSASGLSKAEVYQRLHDEGY